MTDLAQIAYEASQRALDKQERVLDELRSRTSILLAAASLAISFLGRSAVDTSVSAVALVAVLSFAVTIGASVYVLLPKSTFFFAVSGTAVLEQLYEFRDDVPEVRRRLVYDMQRLWENNDRAMQRLFQAFRLAAVGLVVEVVPSARHCQRYCVLAMVKPKPTPPPPPPPTPNIGLPETRGGNGGERK